MNFSNSKWPGAWERHLIRRMEFQQFFELACEPTAADMEIAKSKDQQELSQFLTSLTLLIDQFTTISADTSIGQLLKIKNALDACHDTAFGLATDLTEQKTAITSVNEVVTESLQHAFQDKDERARLRLIQKEATRMEQLRRLEFPIVSDLLRSVCPIPNGEVTGALLTEADAAFKAALETFNIDRKIYLAQRIDIIVADLDSRQLKTHALHKLDILNRQLPGPAKEHFKEEITETIE